VKYVKNCGKAVLTSSWNRQLLSVEVVTTQYIILFSKQTHRLSGSMHFQNLVHSNHCTCTDVALVYYSACHCKTVLLQNTANPRPDSDDNYIILNIILKAYIVTTLNALSLDWKDCSIIICLGTAVYTVIHLSCANARILGYGCACVRVCMCACASVV